MKESIEAGGDCRRQCLIKAAFDLIAQEGFEGLRTRGIAERVGINVATLHYYFPTKESLIAGVAEYMSVLFKAVQADPVEPSGVKALDELRQVFANSRHYRRQCPDLLIVMQELMLRARRDEIVQSIMSRLLSEWRERLCSLILEGQQSGVFADTMPAEQLAGMVQALLSGTFNLGFDEAKMQAMAISVERLFVAKEIHP